MRRGERLFVYGGVVTALVIALSGHVGGLSSAAAVGHGLRTEPASVRIAVCDLYLVADKLIESDRYQPRMKAEEERIRAAIAPLEEELQQMQARGMTMNPESAEARALFTEFQRKQQALGEKVQRAQMEYQAFLATIYVEAYEAARASADAIADDLNFSYVIASRRKDEKIETTDLGQVIQAVLARPVAKAPEGSDITEDVLKDLKL